MRNERRGPARPPERRVQRHLVDVLEQKVTRVAPKRAAIVGVGEGTERPPDAYAMHLHAVDARARSGAQPTATQQRDVVSALREPAKNLMQMNLGAARLRILDVL